MAKAEKSPGGVAARVEKLVRPTIEGMGLRLWDVQFEKEGPGWTLRVLIDRDEPLDTDTCEAASRAIDPILDEADPIDQSYCLEVGSPGLGRRLVRPHHFAALLGQKVRAGLYKADEQGRKEVAGLLQSWQDGEAVLLCEGEEIRLPKGAAAGFWACDDEGLFD